MDGIVAWWPRKGWKVRMRFSILASQRKTISRFRAHFPVQCVQFGSWLLTTSQGKVIATLSSGGALAANKGFFFLLEIVEKFLSTNGCFPRNTVLLRRLKEAHTEKQIHVSLEASRIRLEDLEFNIASFRFGLRWWKLNGKELYFMFLPPYYIHWKGFICSTEEYLSSTSTRLFWVGFVLFIPGAKFCDGMLENFFIVFFFTCVGCGETSWMDLNCFFVTWQANWMPDRTLLYVSGCMILACLNYLINYLSWLFG